MIYLDSCILIYATENLGLLGQRARSMLRLSLEQNMVISPLVRLECLVKPIRDRHLAFLEAYDIAFAMFESLAIHEETFIWASHLRAQHGLKTPDALHLAVAQMNQCSELWTNDNRLAVASQGLARNIL